MQRKLNKKFLVVATVVVAAGLAFLVFGGKYFFRGTAQKHIQMAELYSREGRLSDAAEEYKTAIALDRRNPEVYLKLGSVMHQLTRTDPLLVDKDKQYWQMALEADPSYLPAMQLLLDAYLEDVQYLGPQPFRFGLVRDICQRILNIDPTDSRAKANLHISWVQSWLAGVETSQQQVDESIKELRALQEKDPTNLDVPFVFARARINRAASLMGEDRVQEAVGVMAEAENAMQQAVNANPDNARAYLRQGQVLVDISGNFRKEATKRQTYRKMGIAAVARAQELVKPDDQAYLEVNMIAAVLAQQDQKLADAEKIYRDMLAKHPEDRAIRIALAQVLVSDPAKRNDAINLLEESVNDDQSLVGSRVRLRSEMQVKTQIVLANLRIDALAAAKIDEEKTDLEKKIGEHLQDIYNRQGESPDYLRLKGRMYEAKNQYVDAIQTYNRAAAMLAQMGRPQEDDMMYHLARMYIAAQQTGEARTILEGLVVRHEAFAPARILLCRVLLAEGSRDKALPHLDYLERTTPDDPQVTALLLASASGSSQQGTGRSDELLKKLPEGTRDEKLAKARAAYEAGKTDEAQRLSALILAQSPGDEEATQLAAQSFLRQSKPEDARKVVDQALAAKPDSQSLKLVRAQLDGGGEQLMEVLSANIDQIKDEMTRELAKARLADAQGKPEEALTHLKRAEEVKPDAPEPWDQLFQYYARQKEWDKLRPYMDKLTAANQDRAGGLLYQFRLAMAKGETDHAVEVARQLTTKLPEFAQSWLALAQALQATRKFDEAKQAYLRVLEKQPNNLDAYRGLVDVCYLLRQYDDAGRHIAEARKRLPGNTILRQMEVEHELNFGRPEKVIGVIEAQFAAQIDKPEAWLMLGRAYERILQKKATRGDQEIARWAQKLQEHYSKALDKWPDNPEFAGRLANAFTILNKRDEAEKVLKAYVQKTGGKAAAILMLADFHLAGGEPNLAELTLRDAIAKDATQIELWQRLAAIQVQNGKPDDAIATLDKAPDQAAVLMQKLEVMLQVNKTKEAKEMIQAALKSRGDDFGLVNAQAYVALQENDLAAAKAFADRSLQLKPNNPIALHQRALAKLREANPDVDGAIVDLRLAIQQAPTNVELRMTTCSAYLSRSDRESAIREAEMAASLAPRNKMVWTRLMELYLDSNPPRLDDAKSLIEQVRAAGGDDLDLTLTAGRIATARKDAQSAISEMRRAIHLSSNTNANETITRDYMLMLLELKQYPMVLTETEQLLDRGVWWVRHVRAVAKARMGDREEALAEWEQAIQLADKNRDDTGALLIMQGVAKEMGVSQIMPKVLERAKQETRWAIFAAWLYQSEHDWKNAVSTVEQVIASVDKMTPEEQVRAWQVAGAVYLTAQPPMADKAVDCYQRLLGKDAEDLATLNNLACLYVDNVSPPNPAKALEYSQKAYDVMRKRGLTEPLVMDTHGWVLTQAGRVQEGIVLLQDVVARRPFLDARYHLAEAYLLGNYADAAVRQLNEANSMIADAESKKTAVDPQMKAKIEQAMARAVARSKEQAAN